MNTKLIIATATVLTIAIAAPQGSIAFAQSSSTEEGKKTEMDGMMKKKDGMEGMKKKEGMEGMSGMSGKKAGKKGHKGRKGGMGGGMMGMMGGKGGGMGKMQKMRKKMMGKMFMVRAKDYSNADVKRMVDGRLAKHGFSNLLAGDVADGKNEKMAVVTVVSPKGELLFKVRVNRKNGMAAIIE